MNWQTEEQINASGERRLNAVKDTEKEVGSINFQSPQDEVFADDELVLKIGQSIIQRNLKAFQELAK
jgi:hypothetical protein